MSSAATSRVRLLVEIVESGGEKLDQLRRQLLELSKPVDAKINIVSSGGGAGQAVADQENLAKATNEVVIAQTKQVKTSKSLAQAIKSIDQAAQTEALKQYADAAKGELVVQQQRLKEALKYKQQAKLLEQSMEKQKRLAAEQRKELAQQAAALKAAEAETKKAAAAQVKLAAALEAANKKTVAQALAFEQARQKSTDDFQAKLAQVQARAQAEAEKAATKREAAERKLAKALQDLADSQDALKKKTAESAAAQKQFQAAQQGILKESLRKKKALRELQEELARYKKKLEEAKEEMRKHKAEQGGFIDGLENAASTAALLQGPLGGVASRISNLVTILKDVNPVMATTILAVGSLATGFGVAVYKAGQVEAQLLKLEAIIKATGSAAGFTTGQVNEMAKKLGKETLENATEARDALAKLLTFKAVRDDQFAGAVTVLGDMAAVFGSLDEASVQLGKALEDPIQGLGSLREIGVSVTEEQQDMIKELQTSGNLWMAQNEILKILNDQLGGAGKAAGSGLIGAIDTLTEEVSSLFTTIGEGEPLRKATFLFQQLGNAIAFVNSIIGKSSLEQTMVDVAAQADVVRGKLDKIARGEMDPGAKTALQEQLDALNKQGTALDKYKEKLQEREDLNARIARHEKEMQLNLENGIKSNQGILANLAEAAESFGRGNKMGATVSLYAATVGNQKEAISDMKEELKELNAELSEYDKSVRTAAEADKKATEANNRSEGLAQQKRQREATRKLQKQVDRDVAKNKLETLQAETTARLKAEEESYRRGEQSLDQYLKKRTQLTEQQSERQRVILKAELADANANYTARLKEIEAANKKIKEAGGLEIDPKADEKAIRTRAAALVAAEELARFQFEAEGELADIAKSRREEEEKIGNEREQNARQAERDAKREKAEAEALAKARADADEKRRKAILELRALEIDGADAISARLQLAADVIVESYSEARAEIAKVLGEDKALVIDELVDTKSVVAQFDALEQIYQERVSRLNVQLANLEVQKDRGKINYGDFVQGAADAYALADKQLLELIQKMQELADVSGSSELKFKLKELETQFETTKLASKEFSTSVVETLRNASAGIAETGFQSFFDSLFNDITDLEGAFMSLGQSILAEMSKIVSSRIAAEFASMIGGFFEGGSGGGGKGGGKGGAGQSIFGGLMQAAGSYFGGFFATGGLIRGPGTGTSDSITAKLSNHEFVHRERAVRHYGTDFMYALNNLAISKSEARALLEGLGSSSRTITMQIPDKRRFADGGLVTTPKTNKEQAGPMSLPKFEIYNVLDPSEMIRAATSSREGRVVLMNWARSNATELSKLLGKG